MILEIFVNGPNIEKNVRIFNANVIFLECIFYLVHWSKDFNLYFDDRAVYWKENSITTHIAQGCH